MATSSSVRILNKPLHKGKTIGLSNKCRTLLKWFAAFWLYSISSHNALAFTEPCQMVAQVAGSDTYQQQPLKLASLVDAEIMPPEAGLVWMASHGAWHIYQTPEPWIDKNQCAPLSKRFAGKSIEFSPVLLNKGSGIQAVISSKFIIQTYRKADLTKVIQHYGFMKISPLPNPKSAIVDVQKTDSYDLLIQRLDNDRDVKLALPILIEP